MITSYVSCSAKTGFKLEHFFESQQRYILKTLLHLERENSSTVVGWYIA